jgi:hypothetical protein
MGTAWFTFWVFVGNLSSFLTIFTALASGYAAFALWRQRRRHLQGASPDSALERFDEDFQYFATTVSENPGGSRRARTAHGSTRSARTAAPRWRCTGWER